MEDRKLFVLTSRNKRKGVAALVAALPAMSRVEIKPPKRTLPQNALMWVWLTAFAEQATWGGERLTTNEWKDMFTGAVKVAGGGVRAVPGLEGGLMLLGLHTSDMGVAEMADLITYMQSKAAEWGVVLDKDFDGDRDAAGGQTNPAAVAA